MTARTDADAAWSGVLEQYWNKSMIGLVRAAVEATARAIVAEALTGHCKHHGDWVGPGPCPSCAADLARSVPASGPSPGCPRCGEKTSGTDGDATRIATSSEVTSPAADGPTEPRTTSGESRQRPDVPAATPAGGDRPEEPALTPPAPPRTEAPERAHIQWRTKGAGLADVDPFGGGSWEYLRADVAQAESRVARLREALAWALECVPQRLDWDYEYNVALAKARAALE